MPVTSLFNVTANYIDEALAAKAEGRAPAPCAPPPDKHRRPPPFSLRLSDEERRRLRAEAGGAPLGAYIKAKVLGAPLPARRSGLAIEDRKALAHMLALLGGKRLSSHLGELATLAATGSLPLTPETEAELMAALGEIRMLRALLMQALGLREGLAP